LSIVDTILDLEASGALVRYVPTIARDNHPDGPRDLWLTPNFRDWCFPVGPHPDGRIGDGSLAALHAQLNAFVWGEFMEYEVDITRVDRDRDDVWEIRQHLKRPQLRAFGWFVLPKWFVGVHPAVRDDLEKIGGPNWDAAIAIALRARSEMVGSVAFYDDDPEKYLQNPR
jgi:hypothetical protein